MSSLTSDGELFSLGDFKKEPVYDEYEFKDVRSGTHGSPISPANLHTGTRLRVRPAFQDYQIPFLQQRVLGDESSEIHL